MIVNKISAESTDLPTCHYSSHVLIGSIFISCVYRLSKSYMKLRKRHESACFPHFCDIFSIS